MEICKRTLHLNSGHEIPVIGFGTYKIRGRDLIYRVINAALKSGYRGIDTAAVYGNEEDIGFALKELLPKYNLTRENIFITTKLAPNDHGEERVYTAVQKSLKNLGVDYIDLYLIHWPGVSGLPVDSTENINARSSSWNALVALQNKGLLRSIGVSNYTVKHLTELLSHKSGIKPSVNQVEIHPFFRQEQLVCFCERYGILIQAYCSMGGSSGQRLLNEPNVQQISMTINKTPAQVLLKWAIQHGYAVIPKSIDEGRIDANANLNFEISKDNMEILDKLSTVVKFAWDPDIVMKYSKLPKTGKPNSNQCTVMACIVKIEGEPSSKSIVNVVSLGTGSKCIGPSKMNPGRLNDSHAEVIARRGFLRYLYSQINIAFQNDSSSIFEKDNVSKKFVLKDNITFHFFVSHTPCGDASIFPKSMIVYQSDEKILGLVVANQVEDKIENIGTQTTKSKEENSGKKRSLDDVECETAVKRVADIYRTGSKCIVSETLQDPLLPGMKYHVLRALRNKPGRGERCLSLSCSDKMARWTAVGIQGALLSLLITEPVYLHSIVIGGGCPYSEQALRRAVVDRLSCVTLKTPFRVAVPVFLQSTIPFSDGLANNKKPCPASLIWTDVEHRPLEVAVDGIKQGVTKKNINSITSELMICKKGLFQQFISCASLNSDINLNQTYSQFKATAYKYKSAWNTVRLCCFSAWPDKPNVLYNFTSSYTHK